MSRNFIFGVMLIFFMLQICFKHDSQNTALFRFGNDLYAQTSKHPYKKYGNRREGIVKRRQLVAGEKLGLISVAIENTEQRPQNVDKFNLAFHLSKPARLKIEVWEYEHYYKMQPLTLAYNAGAHNFSWPANIPDYYNIGIEDLYPLAKIRGSAGTIVPVVLYYEKPRSRKILYRFSFIANKTISVLEYSIYDSTNKKMFSGRLQALPGGKIFHIRWNGKDMANKTVNYGSMVLNVQATFAASPSSETHRIVTVNNGFYHLAND